jgi:nicotinate-nucleotide pyrophosphorylase (carboxylating)
MRQPLENLVLSALAEDIGHHDLTTYATVPEDARCEARLIAKSDGVLSGILPFRMAFKKMRAKMRNWESKNDGDRISSGDIVASFSGRTRAVLAGERTAMNFIQHLSGVATLTAQFVAAVADLDCRVADTRKTTPMLRELEKAAVKHGGGANHRHSLESGVLIKENHITAAGGITQAVRSARAYAPHLLRIEVEVRNLDELEEALAAGAEVIMLDNMDNGTMREAVRRAHAKNVILEASGNASLERLRGMAETGVDVISVGALTHSAPILDMSLIIDNS